MQSITINQFQTFFGEKWTFSLLNSRRSTRKNYQINFFCQFRKKFGTIWSRFLTRFRMKRSSVWPITNIIYTFVILANFGAILLKKYFWFFVGVFDNFYSKKILRNFSPKAAVFNFEHIDAYLYVVVKMSKYNTLRLE